MIGLTLEFLAGRYHATPWGHHVNEGLVEWPPSPWRLARALAAASFRLPEGPSPLAKALISRLACETPFYALPPTRSAHTRHYMPSGGSTTKLLDTFNAMDRHGEAAVEMFWPEIDLSVEERTVLERLAAEVTYLGRAESWVSVTLCDRPPSRIDASPTLEADESIDLPVVMPAPAISAWAEGLSSDERKRLNPPATPWDVVLLDTGWLHDGRWSAPPGVHTVRYGVRTRRAPRAAARSVDLWPEVALFAVRSRVLPPAGEVLNIGDAARRALLRRSDGGAVFLGRDDEGRPLRGNRHAYIIPVVEAGAGVSRLAVVCAEGFDPDAVTALRGLRWLSRGDGRSPRGEEERLQLTLVGLGSVQDFAGEDGPGRLTLPHFARATNWQTATPFVCFRHPKLRNGVWRDTPEEQLALAIRQVHPEVGVVRVERALPRAEEGAWSRGFRRVRRRGGGSRWGDTGHCLRVVLDRPIQGPLCVGYGAHMGLGQMVPVE